MNAPNSLTSAAVLVLAASILHLVRYRRQRAVSLAKCRTPLDFELHAKRFGNPLAVKYYSYVSGRGETLKECVERSFQNIKLVPRSMCGVQSSPATTYFQKHVKMPLIIAPTALHSLADPRGEIATATGAGQAGVVYSYNYFLASQPVEEIAKVPGEKWLHLYIFEERYLVEFALEECLEKYKGTFSAVIVTCDHPHNRVRDYILPYFREFWYRANFSLVFKPYMPNLARAAGLKKAPTMFDVLLRDPHLPGTNDSTLVWQDLKWLADKIAGRVPLVAKGVLHPQDALRAVEMGAQAVVVSNHGGRQVDGSIPAVEALPGVIAAIKAAYPSTLIFCDTGVRSSTDVCRIMALGAHGALIGRSPLFALCCGGSDALHKMLSQWGDDIRDDMKCLGWESFSKDPPKGIIFSAHT